MSELLEAIQVHATAVQASYSGEEITLKGLTLPDDYWSIVRLSDGFVMHDNMFRLFSVRAGTRSLEAQNSSDWARAYGSLLDGFVIIAEDVFGDLYGYKQVGSEVELAKFYCEGGELEFCEPRELSEFLEAKVLVDSPSAFDVELIREALRRGYRCSVDQHLAFSLPLIAGGEYSLANLDVESRELHLGLLAQLSLSTRSAPDGTAIARFVEDDGEGSTGDPRRGIRPR